MCMQFTGVRPYQRWHWAGDEIVYDPIVPASRTIPGTKRARYPIDIRQYVSIEGNAVIRGALTELRESLPPGGQTLFGSRQPGAFDFRARSIAEFVSRRIAYRRSTRQLDQWLFPEETLALRRGDCEDLAFLLAALLEASGVSSFCLRVALGIIVDHTNPTRPRRWHHAWVVYQDEGGFWQIIEPLALVAPQRGQGKRRTPRRTVTVGPHPDFEYIPHFVFNRQHLWRVRSPEDDATGQFRQYLKERKFWKGFDPSFAIWIHESIYDDALSGMPSEELDAVKQWSFWADVNVLRYDPRDHFDFSYIEEGWGRLHARLASASLADFAYAMHALADFYAHSLYADFAEREDDGSLRLYDPDSPIPPSKLVYDFTAYSSLPDCLETPAQAAGRWKGKLISGQWWRWYTTFPDELERSSGFQYRRCLPDHDEVAVDGPGRKEPHHYDVKDYPEQFRLRRKAAVEHIRRAYQDRPPKF